MSYERGTVIRDKSVNRNSYYESEIDDEKEERMTGSGATLATTLIFSLISYHTLLLNLLLHRL